MMRQEGNVQKDTEEKNENGAQRDARREERKGGMWFKISNDCLYTGRKGISRKKEEGREEMYEKIKKCRKREEMHKMEVDKCVRKGREKGCR